MTVKQGARPLRNTLIVLNELALLMYSTNFMPTAFLATKLSHLAMLMLTCSHTLMMARQRLDRLTTVFLLLLTFAAVGATANYLRFSNANSLYLDFSYLFKEVSM